MSKGVLFLVCATGYEECSPVAVYSDRSMAEAEAERVRAIRNARFDGDGATVYDIPLNPKEVIGRWLVWLKEDGSWEGPFWSHSYDMACGGGAMITPPGAPREWRGCGKTREEAEQWAVWARDTNAAPLADD